MTDVANANGTDTAAAVRPFLPGSLSDICDEPEVGAFASNTDFLRTLEAHFTLSVALYKLAGECQQRVLSHSSRDFGDGVAGGVQRALHALPALKSWVERLGARIEARGALPIEGTELKPRFVRVCEVYELAGAERQILGALLMQRASHAFATVKLSSQLSYGGHATASGAKPGVTLGAILGVGLAELLAFQKPERRHVKQGVVLPAQQVLAEVPALQPEAVLLLLALPLTESQLFNIEKSDLMRVLREEPGFEESSLSSAAKKRDEAATVAADDPGFRALAEGKAVPENLHASLYSLLKREVAAEKPPSPLKNGVRANGKSPSTGDGDADDDADGDGDGGEAEGEGEAAASEGDTPTTKKKREGAYENDLEYLQDMFALVKLRSDVARVRRHMEERGQQMAGQGKGGGSDGDGSDDGDLPPMYGEDWGGYGGMDEDAYEMEAMARGRFGRNLRMEASKQARHEGKRARKLDAKAERLAARIDRRLATMAEASARLPRLERLSAALGLVDFEKNVVVAMIGQAIAPRSIGIMGGGGGGGGPSKTMQVEVLLRAFSHTLQQQIRNRRFFYKSAVLVREGTRLKQGASHAQPHSGWRTAHVSSPHPAPPSTGARGDPRPTWRRVGRRPHADARRGRPPDARLRRRVGH